MDRKKLMEFKSLFEEQRSQLRIHKGEFAESLHIGREDLADETDLSTTELHQAMRLRLRTREGSYLKKIDEALRRIQEGSFGLCVECGDEIEDKRLTARPTTSHCISCKEAQEHKELLFMGAG